MLLLIYFIEASKVDSCKCNFKFIESTDFLQKSRLGLKYYFAMLLLLDNLSKRVRIVKK